MSSPKEKSAAREYAFQFLYQFLSSGKWPTDTGLKLEHAMSDFERSRAEGESAQGHLAPGPKKFAEELIKGVCQNRQALEDKLRPHMQLGTEKTHKVDMGVLLTAAYELEHNPGTPAAVVINEAVDLVKRYGEARSGAFINAVLDSLAKGRSKKDGK